MYDKHLLEFVEIRYSLQCFDTVFLNPYKCFSIALKVILSLSDCYKIFSTD